MLSSPSFRQAFVFSINSIILSGFPLTSFHLVEASLSVFSWLYTFEGEFVQKYHKMSFIYSYSHFQDSFFNQHVLFALRENANKLWNKNRILHVNEQNKSKTKSRHIQTDHALYYSIHPANIQPAMVSLKDGFTV